MRALIQKFQSIPPFCNYVALPTCLDSLAAGILLVLVLKYRRDLVAGRARLIWTGTLAIVGAWIENGNIPNPFAIRLAFLGYSAHAVIFARFIVSVLIAPNFKVSRAPSLKWVRELGNMACSTCLLHRILLYVTCHVERC